MYTNRFGWMAQNFNSRITPFLFFSDLDGWMAQNFSSRITTLSSSGRDDMNLGCSGYEEDQIVPNNQV